MFVNVQWAGPVCTCRELLLNSRDCVLPTRRVYISLGSQSMSPMTLLLPGCSSSPFRPNTSNSSDPEPNSSDLSPLLPPIHRPQSLVPGTGPGGRILKSDVLNFDPAASSAAAAAFPAAAAQAAAAPPAAAKAAPLPISYPKAPAGQDTVHKVTGLQRVMVQTMTAAAAVPTFLYQDEIRVDNLVHARAQGKRMLESRAKARGTASVKLTYMPFFMKAMSLALRDYPQLNALVNSDCSEVVHKGALDSCGYLPACGYVMCVCGCCEFLC